MYLSYKGQPMITAPLTDTKLHEITDWKNFLSLPFNKSALPSKIRTQTRGALGKVINDLFGAGGYGVEDYIRPRRAEQ